MCSEYLLASAFLVDFFIHLVLFYRKLYLLRLFSLLKLSLLLSFTGLSCEIQVSMEISFK